MIKVFDKNWSNEICVSDIELGSCSFEATKHFTELFSQFCAIF